MKKKVKNGSCLCGRNKFYSLSKPLRSVICYCRYCQLRTGSVFGVTYWFNECQIKFKKKYVKKYIFNTENGNKFTTYSCKKCSSSIYWTISHLKKQIGLAGGMYDKPSFQFKIDKEIFTRTKPKFLNKICKLSFLKNLNFKPKKKDPKYLQG
jgi:hypothetical protein